MGIADAHTFKMSEPSCLTNIMVNAPCCLLGLAFILMFTITLVVANFGWLLP